MLIDEVEDFVFFLVCDIEDAYLDGSDGMSRHFIRDRSRAFLRHPRPLILLELIALQISDGDYPRDAELFVISQIRRIQVRVGWENFQMSHAMHTLKPRPAAAA